MVSHDHDHNPDQGQDYDQTNKRDAEGGKAPGAPVSLCPASERVVEAPAIEPAGSELTSDDEFIANNVDEDLVSVASSIYAHTYERGRRYHTYENSRYPIPNDDIEQGREDMKHVMLMELTDGKLFYSPIGKHPQKIVDIGTGTGKY